MNDRHLLFSLLALPACGSTGSGGGSLWDLDGDSSEKIESSCLAAQELTYACYEPLGYGSSGGAYGSSGSYGTDDYVEAYCAEVQRYAEAYGPGCVGAFEEVFACLASLDCATVLHWQDDLDAYAPEPCRGVFRDANARCPEAFPQCTYRGYSSSGSGCGRTASGCVDGTTYGAQCSESGATRSCECERNGGVQRTVTVGGDLECSSQELSDELADACGFPPGVF